MAERIQYFSRVAVLHSTFSAPSGNSSSSHRGDATAMLFRAPSPCPTYATLSYNEKEALLAFFGQQVTSAGRLSDAATLLSHTYGVLPNSLSVAAVSLPLERANKQTKLVIELTLALAARRAQLGANLQLVSTMDYDAHADRTKLMQYIDAITGHSAIDGTTTSDRVLGPASVPIQEVALAPPPLPSAASTRASRSRSSAAADGQARVTADGAVPDYKDVALCDMRAVNVAARYAAEAAEQRASDASLGFAFDEDESSDDERLRRDSEEAARVSARRRAAGGQERANQYRNICGDDTSTSGGPPLEVVLVVPPPVPPLPAESAAKVDERKEGGESNIIDAVEKRGGSSKAAAAASVAAQKLLDNRGGFSLNDFWNKCVCGKGYYLNRDKSGYLTDDEVSLFELLKAMVLRNIQAAVKLVGETNGGGRRKTASNRLTIPQWRELVKELEAKVQGAARLAEERELELFNRTTSLRLVREGLSSSIAAHKAMLNATSSVDMASDTASVSNVDEHESREGRRGNGRGKEGNPLKETAAQSSLKKLVEELDQTLRVTEIPKPVVCGFSSVKDIFDKCVEDAFALIRDDESSGGDVKEVDLKDIIKAALGTVQTSLFYSTSEEIALSRELVAKSEERADEAERQMKECKNRAERAERMARNADAIVAAIRIDSLSTLAATITFAKGEGKQDATLTDLLSVRRRGLREVERQLDSVRTVLSNGGEAILKQPLISVVSKSPSVTEIAAETARQKEQLSTVKGYARFLTEELIRLKGEKAKLDEAKLAKKRQLAEEQRMREANFPSSPPRSLLPPRTSKKR